MNLKSGNQSESQQNGSHRVLLVILLFVPISLLAMWFIGGTKQTIELAVHSNLTPEELQQRFEQVLAKLQPVTQQQLAERATIQSFGTQGSNRVTTPDDRARLEARPVNFVSPTFPTGSLLQVGNSFPLADIVLPEEFGHEVPAEIDPSIIYRDPQFIETPVARHWLGKDQRNVYLEETDTQEHLQLIRLELDKLRFEPLMIDGEAGTRLVYPISICHQGFKRIYGKFLERECENIAKSRLDWVCKQLEAVQ